MSPLSIGWLVGETLSSVVFVSDYVQLDFNGPRLTLWVWPAVVTDGVEVRMGAVGYRDTLCALIGRTVLGALETREDGLVLDFERMRVVSKPRPADMTGPEMAMLMDTSEHGGRWDVWRWGEFPFDTPEWTDWVDQSPE